MTEDPDFGKRVVGKVTARLIPFIFLCYVIAYIDRVNIGFVKGPLQADLGLSAEVFGRGAGIFFIGYCLFEIPSNLVLAKVGARVWIARIMIVWGLVSAFGMMLVRGTWSWYGMRFLLGVAEAGFFPGMVLYLTYWVPSRYRARINALFMMAAPISIAVGAPISQMILKMDGLGGVKGWHWLFILEGIPAVILGLLALKFLTDRPEKASWLKPEERAWLEEEMARERAAKALPPGHSEWKALGDPKLLLLCAIYFLQALVTYGIFLWLPAMMEKVTGLKGLKLGLVSAIPFIAAIAGMILIGMHSDRKGERKLHVAFCAGLAAVGIVLAVVFRNNGPLFVAAFAICQVGQRSVMSVFWSIPPIFLAGSAAAAGIALINSIGNLGGYFGADLMGTLYDRTGGYTGGLLCLAAGLVVQALLVLCIRLPKAKAA